MKNDAIKKWLPCQNYCQMSGAAAAILSLQGARVIFNGPRWCSVIAERELTSHKYEYMYRMYCSHIEQCDLLFGTESKLQRVFEDIAKEETSPTLLVVLTSCSVGLIGDDVAGIVTAQGWDWPSFAMDTGGLTGLFEEGYQLTMLKIIQSLKLKKTTEPKPKRINLLGFNNTDPCNEGDIRELKRLLELVGLEVGVCLGEEELTLEKLKELPEAALNVVLSEELALEIGKHLEQSLEQHYLNCPMPYGLRATEEWLKAISKALAIEINTKALDYEIYRLKEDLGQQYAMMKYRIPTLQYQGAKIYLPYSKATSLAKAMERELLQLKNIELRIEGNYKRSEDKECAKVSPDLNTYTILFGTVNDRIIEAKYANTIYINSYKQEGILKSHYRSYVGLRGWSELIAEIFRQTLTLNFLKEDKNNYV